MSSRSRRGRRDVASDDGDDARCCAPLRAAGSRLGAGMPGSALEAAELAPLSSPSEYGSMDSETRCLSASMPMMRTFT